MKRKKKNNLNMKKNEKIEGKKDRINDPGRDKERKKERKKESVNKK